MCQFEGWQTSGLDFARPSGPCTRREPRRGGVGVSLPQEGGLARRARPLPRPKAAADWSCFPHWSEAPLELGRKLPSAQILAVRSRPPSSAQLPCLLSHARVARSGGDRGPPGRHEARPSPFITQNRDHRTPKVRRDKARLACRAHPAPPRPRPERPVRPTASVARPLLSGRARALESANKRTRAAASELCARGRGASPLSRLQSCGRTGGGRERQGCGREGNEGRLGTGGESKVAEGL